MPSEPRPEVGEVTLWTSAGTAVRRSEAREHGVPHLLGRGGARVGEQVTRVGRVGGHHGRRVGVACGLGGF